jgi:hypothetical protein
MNGAQALFKALTDAGIDSISRDTLIRDEFLAASAAVGVTIILPGGLGAAFGVKQSKEKGHKTPLLHKDALESNGCSHKKGGFRSFGILFKSHSWINPGNDIDFTAVPRWLRV